MKKKERKLLVVDDNIDFVQFIRRALEQEDYRISIALDGKTAIQKASTENPELILLDMKLPDMSGEEVFEKVKEVNKDIPVVVITGFVSDTYRSDAFAAHADGFLCKPFKVDQIKELLKKHLGCQA